MTNYYIKDITLLHLLGKGEEAKKTAEESYLKLKEKIFNRTYNKIELEKELSLFFKENIKIKDVCFKNFFKIIFNIFTKKNMELILFAEGTNIKLQICAEKLSKHS